MNPILLKPQGDRTSQLVVRGAVRGTRSALDYFRHPDADLWAVVTESLTRLREEYDLVVAEGAGSPAEINLRQRDLVNMRLARHARADVLIVGDIDRGGVFASLLGVWEWLDEDERALVRGFVINKFRGDPTLLAPAPQLLEERTGVRVLGVLPWLDDLVVPDEDAASLTQRTTPDPLLEIALPRLPHLANFDEFAALANEAGVQVRWVTRATELRAPDLIILPGSKATIPDLMWVVERGLAARIGWLAGHGTPVLGICAGFQMLGETVRDPLGIESDVTSARGLGLLPLETELGGSKRLARTTGHLQAGIPGVWSMLGTVAVDGYEIHIGRTTGQPIQPLLELTDHTDGAVSADGAVAGTYVHGLLEAAAPRHALLGALAERRGFSFVADPTPTGNPFDRVADAIEANLRLEPRFLPALAALSARPTVTIRP
jgi:adenosylcobyric acid synthase